MFGVHCVGGIIGALGTAIVAAPSLGGQGAIDFTKIPYVATSAADYNIINQLIIQAEAVGMTLLWSGLGSAILFFILDKTMGLRPEADAEREGLDLSSHGERAYNY